MGLKGLAIVATWLALLQTPFLLASTGGDSTASRRQNAPVLMAEMVLQQSSQGPASGSESEGTAHDLQPPHISVANPPAPAPSVWSWQDEVAWVAKLLLAVVGYVGIMLAVSLLKKIERQTAYAEAAADAAASSAQAALLSAQAFIHSERPWILITVEPSRSLENSFTVLATNRGRTPARIVATTEDHRIVLDEKRLPGLPEYENEEQGAPFTPIILLPGEFSAIKSFCREDVKGLCDSVERFKRIETWEEKVYLYGKVDLPGSDFARRQPAA